MVKLTEEERKPLVHLLMRGEEKVGKLMRAQVLRLSGKRDAFIAEAVRINLQTVRNRHKRFAQEGGEAALEERLRPGARPKPDVRGKGS